MLQRSQFAINDAYVKYCLGIYSWYLQQVKNKDEPQSLRGYDYGESLESKNKIVKFKWERSVPNLPTLSSQWSASVTIEAAVVVCGPSSPQAAISRGAYSWSGLSLSPKPSFLVFLAAPNQTDTSTTTRSVAFEPATLHFLSSLQSRAPGPELLHLTCQSASQHWVPLSLHVLVPGAYPCRSSRALRSAVTSRRCVKQSSTPRELQSAISAHGGNTRWFACALNHSSPWLLLWCVISIATTYWLIACWCPSSTWTYSTLHLTQLSKLSN